MSWSDGRWRRAICDNRARVAIKKGFRKKKQSVWSSVQKKSSPAKQTGPQTQIKTKTPKALMSNVDASYLGRRWRRALARGHASPSGLGRLGRLPGRGRHAGSQDGEVVLLKSATAAT